MTPRNRLYIGAALGLTAAATLGFGCARVTQSPLHLPVPANSEAASTPKPTNAVEISQDAIAASRITVGPANAGGLDAAILASATVEATPDAEAVLTARAPGTVTRIFVRIGDSVRAGETVAMVESQEASQIVADRTAAAARFTLATRQLARERTLLGQGVSPRADYETAQANLIVAQADAQRVRAAASAARVASDGRSVSVVSPISGRVTNASAALGQFVAAETELLRIADPRRLQITASVPPADASRIRSGDRVEMSSSAGQTVEGRVRSSTGVVDPRSRTATVVVTPTAVTSSLIPGQLVQARIFASGGVVRNGVIVPQDAVQTLGGQSVVFVRTRGGFRAQPVQIGSRSSGMVSILGGLSADTPIATVNAFLLKAEIEKETAE